MRVIELHIENIRGIKSIDLKPEGKNFVIYGPNGTGKSAVVDALDFLFTGQISRLRGEGASGITLGRHGCHIDSEPKDTVVQAVVQIPALKETFIIRRSISDPGSLKILKGDESKLSEYQRIAARGHHVLSRRNILKYVAAPKGERAKEIQALLNLERIERIRQVFVSVETDKSRIYESHQLQYNSAKSNICHYLPIDHKEFSESRVIKEVNVLRSMLKGASISSLEEKAIKESLSPPSIPLKGRIVEPNFIKSNMGEILRMIKEDSEGIRSQEIALISNLRKLKGDDALKKELQNLKLLELGISLLDDSGKCPLCEKAWDPKELKGSLSKRLLSAKEAKQMQDGVNDVLDILKTKYNELRNSLVNVEKALEIFGLEETRSAFKQWIQKAKDYLNALDDAENKVDIIAKYLTEPLFFAPEDLEGIARTIEKKAETEGKKLTEEQLAWDTLTKLEPLARTYKKAKIDKEKSEVAFKRAQLSKNTYEEAKDRVLNALFGEIKDDFVEYYKFMHGADEEKFDADFQAKGAELRFEVEFYGRGKFPPIALHSEGHQDSMGVCLYLALMKLLSKGKMYLTVLDDVVMSIDSGHRKAFSQLLQKYFPDRQFLITTHNRTWARQLQTDGVVSPKNKIEFNNWSVDTGPKYDFDYDVWKKIDEFLANNNVSSAAHALREEAEFYFNQVCEKIMAKSIHKVSSKHELGDLLPSAIGQYNDVLRLAKKAANSWGNKELVEKLSEAESISKEVIVRSQVNQWGINENVHYSKWVDFSKEDFRPIVEAFKDLFDLFKCSECGGIFFVSLEGKEPRNLRCNCQKVDWNLLSKKMSH